MSLRIPKKSSACRWPWISYWPAPNPKHGSLSGAIFNEPLKGALRGSPPSQHLQVKSSSERNSGGWTQADFYGATAIQQPPPDPAPPDSSRNNSHSLLNY